VSKYLAAYLLLNAAGSAPTADKITSVLESVGIEAEEAQVSALISALEGKTVEELIAEGNEKLASVPTGGAGAAPAAGASGAAAEEAAAEVEEEAAEESDDDMGFGLFD
jgi:large subunit ribosomal protein LP2